MRRARAAALGLAVVVALTSLACTQGEHTRWTASFDNLTGWNIYQSVGHAGNGARMPDTVTVADGILTITGRANGSTGGLSWTGHTQQYGQWDIRMRAPAGCACYHPVVLLWGTGGGDGVNNPNGEIDIVESFQNAARDQNAFSLHFGDGSQFIGANTTVDMTQWHDYHLLWREDLISTWIDDNPPYYETRDTSKFPRGAVDVAIQLDWFPQESRTGGATASMEVDYVTQTLDAASRP